MPFLGLGVQLGHTLPPSGGGAWNGNTYSIDLDGTDDYVDTGNKFDFIQQTMNFTISAWIKFQDYTLTRNQYILHTTDSGSRIGFMLWFDNRSGQNYLRSLISPSSSTGAYAQDVNAISDNNWHHVAVTCAQGGSIRLYVDGSQLNSSSAPSTTTATAMHNFIIGGALNTSGQIVIPFQGNIDEVGIFNTELSSSDITSIYNSGPDDLSSFNPVGWWRMGDNDGGTGTTITDQGSGGNDGTLTNGPTFSTDVPVAPLTNTYSLSFDGTNDYGDAGIVSALQNTSAFSVSVWFVKGATSEFPAWGGYSSGTDQVSGHGYLNDLWFNVRGGYETRYVVPSSNLPSDTTSFHHYVYTFDGGTFKVYVDGTERSGTKFNSGTTSTGTANFNFKLGYQGFHYDQGLYDEFAIFSSALSSSDVTAIYNSGTPDSLSSYSPVAWWRMEEGSGTSVVNTANSGTNDVTLYNGPTFSTDTP